MDPSEFKDDERRDSLDSEEVDSPFCECESPSPEPVYEKNNAVKGNCIADRNYKLICIKCFRAK